MSTKTTISRKQRDTLAETLNLNTDSGGKLTIDPWTAVDTMLAAAIIEVEKTAEEKVDAFLEAAFDYNVNRETTPTGDDYEVLLDLLRKHLA